LTKGLTRAGFRVIGAVDNHPLSVKTYRANHPSVRVWEDDIKQLSVREVKEKLRLENRTLDLLAGCPPCQGFSRMRTKNGKRRPREPLNDLLFQFQRFVNVLRPRAVMLENVPGLARNDRFRRFRSRLRKLGYVGEWRVLNAADYGVPQRRRRLIYVAGLHAGIAFAEPSKSRRTVRGAIGKLRTAGKSGDAVHDLPEHRSPEVRDLIKRIPKDGGSRTDLPRKYQLECHQNEDVGFKDVYGRMAWDEPAPTITGGCFNPSKGRFLHPKANRAITMREAALLQGFPRGYEFPVEGQKQALALMIGNALPPAFVAAHARSVRRTLAARGTNTAPNKPNKTR
jgi:DNA (cytosine-5)-methyltransferase 1